MTDSDPPPLKGGRLSHVFLSVRDLAESVRFYTALLGFSVCHSEQDVCAFLELPASAGLRIALYASKDCNRRLESGRLLMIDVPSIVETIELLQSRGISVGPIENVPFGLAATLIDPDGNLLEIHESRHS